MAATSTGATYGRDQADALRAAVTRIVTDTPVTDIHTHLYAPPFGELLLFGIDELLTYHYLVAELLRVSNVSYDAFWAMPKPAQADLVWKELFLERSPISEACRGVLTALDRLGLDTASRSLGDYRAWFRDRDPNAHIDAVFARANISSAVMTNDPFDDLERPTWEAGYAGDPRFHAALRIDPLLNAWPAANRRLSQFGYDVGGSIDTPTINGVRKFLDDRITRMKALYMAVSLPPDFAFPEDSARAKLLEHAVLPAARDHHIPFALMVGVTRQVNPALRLAGDGVGYASLAPLHHLCAHFPDNKFMTTYLARENQHELCVAARKFRNLLVFGCWWFLNNPSLIDEMTRMRIEMLGLSVVPQHSDARVLEQVIYKWDHSRTVIAQVLADKFADLVRSGWTVTEDEIRRDAATLLGGAFWDFARR